MSTITLDHIKGISFSSDSPPIRNIQALYYLPSGIQCLAQTVRAEEIKNNRAQLSFAVLGSINPIVVVAFDWFVISTTNYARIVGLIDLMVSKNWKTNDLSKSENYQKIKEHCDTYVEKVMPGVNKWRNKVAAHPAATAPRGDDNIATIEYSLMQLISYVRPYFKVEAKWNTQGHESELPSWALTEVFEKDLIPRFWPDLKLDPIEPLGGETNEINKNSTIKEKM